MDTFFSFTAISIAVVLAIGLATGLVVAWRRAMQDSRTLPFFRKLDLAGVTVKQAEEALGIDALAHAVRRCAFCGEKDACHAGQRFGWLRRQPVDCPNQTMFRRVKGVAEEEAKP